MSALPQPRRQLLKRADGKLPASHLMPHLLRGPSAQVLAPEAQQAMSQSRRLLIKQQELRQLVPHKAMRGLTGQARGNPAKVNALASLHFRHVDQAAATCMMLMGQALRQNPTAGHNPWMQLLKMLAMVLPLVLGPAQMMDQLSLSH